ncbi:MAG: transketolase [Treponema sp.]|jgi:transketolase|nr:transketolase [Treponema sp.]
MDTGELEKRAARCRRKILRMIRAGGAGHVGGALSCVDMVTALYFHTLKQDPANPQWPERDRFVLSAGHKCMALYAVLAERGYFEPAVLDTYGRLGTKIPGHPDMYKLPGVEANTGALGHGLSIGVGMALGLRDQGSRVFVLTGDGELPEGSNWEAAAAAAHHRLDNLTALVDDNGLQISGKTVEVMNMEPVAAHFAGFGWAVTEIDGNNMDEIVKALDSLPLKSGVPSLIVAHTVKGRGIGFLEGTVGCHYWKPPAEELAAAERELDAALAEADR